MEAELPPVYTIKKNNQRFSKLLEQTEQDHLEIVPQEAIALISRIPYRDVWFELTKRKKLHVATYDLDRALTTTAKKSMTKEASYPFLQSLGYTRVIPDRTMYLEEFENMKGEFLVEIPKHHTFIKNGVIYDTFDCSRAYRKNTKVICYWY